MSDDMKPTQQEFREAVRQSEPRGLNKSALEAAVQAAFKSAQAREDQYTESLDDHEIRAGFTAMISVAVEAYLASQASG